MTTVLVTDGAERSSLAAVRSLGAAGHRVLVAAVAPRSLAAASRWCGGEIVVPDPLRSPSAFTAAIAEAASRHAVDVVLPMTDAATLAVLAQRGELSRAVVPCGTLDAFNRISDKAAAAAMATTLGIRVPRQQVVTATAPPDEPSFPAVLKPARSVAGDTAGRSKHGVMHVADAASLRATLRTLPSTAYPLLIQERIIGPGVGVFLLLWNGELLASFAHRRIREKPPSGGISVYAEAIALDAGLLEKSRALVEAAGWQGLAMVEYKMDAHTAEPVLMEINGRPWGSLQLAIDAGVDFPRLLVAAALGEPVRPVTRWRTGVRTRWFWGDMDHCLTRLRRSSAALHLPPGAPGRIATLAAELVTTLRFPKDQVFRLTDPQPAAREAWQRLFRWS